MTLAYVAAWVIAISAFLILPPIIWFTLRDAARDYRDKVHGCIKPIPQKQEATKP